jgi:Tol biopolymer transport system component
MGIELRRTRWIALLAALTVVAFAIVAPHVAAADYFGRNKVQYRRFDFRVLKTDHFDVYYYDEEKAAAEHAARMAERWYARLSDVLDHRFSRRQPLILYASHPDFEQTNAIEGELGEGTGGVTEFSKQRIVLPLAPTLAETDHVIGHELVHAFQFDIARERRSGAGLVDPSTARLPLWFVEGMAEYLSIGAVDPNTAMWLRDAALHNRLPTIAKLSSPRYFPYRYGHALWAYIGGRWGDAAIGRILKAAGRAQTAEQAIERVTGERADSLSADWQQAIRAWNQPIAAATAPARDYGQLLVGGSDRRGRLAVSPALSPDGSRLMFLSERDLFSIELFLADARNGHVLRRVTRTAVDPHYQSLEFIQSAGAFSPDGRRFAFAAVSHARPVLTVIDVESGRIEHEVPLPGLGEIFNPTWSPDGGRLAVSGMAEGATDLFTVELASGTVRRLTHDAYSDLSPAWSPDGRRIAFATDRFSTRLDDLAYGRERLALIDPESGKVEPVTGFEDAKNIDPQWTADGRGLIFVSDHGGISNLYRVDLATAAISRITNLSTGVSGITPLSPALSVARATDRMVFSVYDQGRYDLYALNAEQPKATASKPALPAGSDPASLPPVARESSALGYLRRDPRLGLADPKSFQQAPYRSSLSLDHISQTTIGVATGSNGLAVGGGTTLFWSDMLGNHNLAALLQSSNQGGDPMNNIAAILAYENRRSRWNWGLAVSQLPYVVREITVDQGTFNGEPAFRQQDSRFWQIDREGQLTAAYPFSRVQRVELGLGYRNIRYESELETSIVSAITGNLLSDQTVSSDTIPSLGMASASAALVYDNSAFGGTSPILGQRYRLEVAPVAGDLDFVGLLGDYRRYVTLARPLTLAGRVLHYGRYGHDGEDDRLGSLFVGYPWLVRGYDTSSFTVEECSTGDCNAIDRLLGSRLAVANLELRLPLLGAAGLARTPGVPPIEVAAFYDAGVAWTQADKASFLGGDRRPVTSRGLALRMNLFGFAVGEAAYVHPDDRPDKGWYWLFSLQPGF